MIHKFTTKVENQTGNSFPSYSTHECFIDLSPCFAVVDMDEKGTTILFENTATPSITVMEDVQTVMEAWKKSGGKINVGT